MKRIATLAVLALISCLYFAPLAVAQDPGDVPPPADTNPDDDSITGVVDGLRKVIQSFGDLGAIAGLAAMIGFLTRLTKVGALNNLIPVTLRPWVAVGLGILGGFFAALAEGGSLGKAILSGILAAAAAVLGDQLLGTILPAARAKKQASAMVAQAMTGSEAEVKAKVSAMKTELDAAATLPDKKSRLQALAALANGFNK